MKLTLLTGSDCPPCDETKQAFEKRYAAEIASNEAQVVNLDENERWQEAWITQELPVAPVMVISTDNNKVIAVLDHTELLKEASPVAAETEKAAVESSS